MLIFERFDKRGDRGIIDGALREHIVMHFVALLLDAGQLRRQFLHATGYGCDLLYRMRWIVRVAPKQIHGLEDVEQQWQNEPTLVATFNAACDLLMVEYFQSMRRSGDDHGACQDCY